MTQNELSPESNSFSTVFNTFDPSESNKFCLDPLPPVTLETYLQGLSECETPTSNFEQVERRAPLPEPRRRGLERILQKLSRMEVAGKEHVEEYLRHQYRCYFRLSTIRGSYAAIEAFLRFMKENGNKGIEQVQKKDLEAFVEHEQDRGLKLSTVKMRLAVLKAFLRFMIERGVVGEEVFPWKLKIKMPETLPRDMDPDDVARLLAVKADVRNRAMILLLLRTAMRIGELLSTKVSDVNMKEQKILIFEGEKNHSGRVVYFGEDAKDALEAWMKKRDNRQEFLFYGQKGNALSYPAARLVFLKYLDKAGLSEKGYTLHCLRHTCATDLLNARMPLQCLEKLMGHSRLEVTQRYARLMDKTREEEYFKAMAIIERRKNDEREQCDRELQEILEKTQLLPAHGEQLHEHP